MAAPFLPGSAVRFSFPFSSGRQPLQGFFFIETNRVLKKAVPALFNYGLHEVNSHKPLKLLDSKILRSFGGTSLYRIISVFFQHAYDNPASFLQFPDQRQAGRNRPGGNSEHST